MGRSFIKTSLQKALETKGEQACQDILDLANTFLEESEVQVPERACISWQDGGTGPASGKL
jgi:hypothetical protein